MHGCNQRIRFITFTVSALMLMAGCKPPLQMQQPVKIAPDSTIGSLVEVFAPGVIPVEGYGLVGGLKGTGSSECPPQIRRYLKQYILAQLPRDEMDVDELIDSKDTAVVHLYALMPTAVTKNQRFDVKVQALPGSQTTSLEDGWLYRAELKRARTFGLSTRILATVQGPVFIDTIDTSQTDKLTGYVLAGGRVRHTYHIRLALRKRDYLVARRISDILNTRFGDSTAQAVSPELVELRIPLEYAEQKDRFIDLVKAMYLVSNPQLTRRRVEKFVKKLASNQDRYASEIALEAIGGASLNALEPLLKSPDDEVRLRAARCFLHLGSDKGFGVLQAMALDRSCPYRIEALQAITSAAKHGKAAYVARKLLRDDSFEVRFAAYEQLRKMDDITISRELIGGKFYLERIAQGAHKDIFVSRSGQPRIVLFGVPIQCRQDIFVQSPDATVTINARPGQQYVSLIRKVPNLPHVVTLRSSYQLSDIIRKLGEEPLIKKGVVLREGLNVSYADTIALIKAMCDSGVVDAHFQAGPLPQIAE